MHRVVSGLALATLLAGGAESPSAASPPQQPPEIEFGAEVAYVEVDALVTDGSGDFVRGLTREDFLVLEEGVAREITTFVEVALPVGESAEGAARLPVRDASTNDEEDLTGRIYTLVLDDLQTHARRSADVREIAGRFVEEYLEPGDVASVLYTGGGVGAVFTGDKRLLLDAIAAFEGRKTGSATLERLSLLDHQKDMMLARASPTEEAFAPRIGRDRDPSDLERVYVAGIAMETLESAARAFASVTGRRKAILLFSEGIDFNVFDAMGDEQRDAARVRQSMDEAVAVATRYNAAVYSVDPRGPLSIVGPDDIQMALPAVDGSGIDLQSLDREVQRSVDSLRMLSRETGGFPVLGTNDFDSAYDLIVRANSRYYLLGYYAADFQPDGAYRRIDVRVRRPGLKVLARDGYVRPVSADRKVDRPREGVPAETSPELVELLGRPLPEPGLPMSVAAAAFREGPDLGSIAFTLEIPGRSLPLRQVEGRGVNELEVTTIALDSRGVVRAGDRLVVQPRLGPGNRELVEKGGLRFVRRLAVPPGRYQLRVAAREAELGQRGSVFHDVEVPAYGHDDLALSGVLLTSRSAAATVTPSVDERVSGLLESPPTASRRFPAGDLVSAYVEVYPEGGGDVSVTARLTDPEGRDVIRADRPAGAAAEPGHVLELPLVGMGPGEYRLLVEARRGIGSPPVSRQVAFEVVPDPTGGDWADAAPGATPADPMALPDVAVPSDRIDRLEAWLEAIGGHEPGSPDASALMVRLWSPPLLAELAADVAMLVRLVRDPGHPVLWLVDPARPGRFTRAPYTTADEVRLRDLAREAAGRCAAPAAAREEREPSEAERLCAMNRILKRGAVLHTDAVIRFTGTTGAAPSGGGSAQRMQVRFSDGQQLGREDLPGHWELAQSLLDNVAPRPRDDETVRLWYLATVAFGQYNDRLMRQEDRAVRLFPRDPHVLFLVGSLHEAFAAPRMQALKDSLRLPWDARHGIESRRAELREAEKYFRRALDADPGHVEARVRLGRVLHQLGRSEEAFALLEQAAETVRGSDEEGGVLLYLVEMFLGAAAEALGRSELARASYERAAETFPAASAPRLAMSHLALKRGDRAAALETARQAMRHPRAGLDRADPWWRYHLLQGRRADEWFERLHASLEPAAGGSPGASP